MTKFKIGDRVKLTGPILAAGDDITPPIGHEGTVIKVGGGANSFGNIQVDWDGDWSYQWYVKEGVNVGFVRPPEPAPWQTRKRAMTL